MSAHEDLSLADLEEAVADGSDAGVFEKAAELLEERGWCQGQIQSPDGRLCFVGALRVAVYGGTHIKANEMYWTDCEGTIHPTDKLKLFLRVMKTATLVLEKDRKSIVAWNDSDARTGDEVIDTMRLIGKDLRNRAQPT